MLLHLGFEPGFSYLHKSTPFSNGFLGFSSRGVKLNFYPNQNFDMEESNRKSIYLGRAFFLGFCDFSERLNLDTNLFSEKYLADLCS